MFDFDRVIDRRGTNCVKYDTMGERPEGTIPMFVADMDFAVAPEIRQAVQDVVDQDIYGYTVRPNDYFDALKGWYDRRYGWSIEPEWLLTTPGVIHALNIAIRAFTKPGDPILIQTPVYGPFGASIKANNRVVADCPLLQNGPVFTIDFERFEQMIVDKQIKLYLHCSPHNPVGRVWTREEQEKIGEICLRHGVTVVADEIHSDFVFPGHKHLNFANVMPGLADITITCTAPSKTFNLAGLENSNILISNPALRETFVAEMGRCNTPGPNIFAYAATRAAYLHGDAWLDALLAYLTESRDVAVAYLKEHLPKAVVSNLEGTYLFWVDLSAYGDEKEIAAKLDEAKVWIINSTSFNAAYNGFWRINIATPRSILMEALERLVKVLA